MRVRNRVWVASWEQREEKDLGSSAQAREPALSLPHSPSSSPEAHPPPRLEPSAHAQRARRPPSPSSAPARPWFRSRPPHPPRGRPVKPRELWERAGKAVGEGGASGYSLHGCGKERRRRRRRPRLNDRWEQRAGAVSAGTGPGHDGITATEPWRRPSGRSGRER